MEFPKELLTDDEIEKLLMQVLKFHHQDPLTEEELDQQSTRIIEWANKARLDASMLKLVLEHDIAVGINQDNEIAFRALTEEERKAKARIVDDSIDDTDDTDDPDDPDPSESWKNGSYDPSAAFLGSQ